MVSLKKAAVLYGVLVLSAAVASARQDHAGLVQGIVHDPQHRPVAGAKVRLAAAGRADATVRSDAAGGFRFAALPAGTYTLVVVASGFASVTSRVSVRGDAAPILHIELRLESTRAAVEVHDTSTALATVTASTTVLNRAELSRTPGGDRTNSLAMITDYVPGAYLVHDQLHIRGGHQVSWLLDGVPIPNTSIASNVGPQLDPKDVDTVEVQRGGYSADAGDRLYGVINVIPRTGFERNREGELVAGYGSWQQTDDQINFGSHTARFAWYASLNGNRANLGLQTPAVAVLHDRRAGLGGFTSLIFNFTPQDQFRIMAAARRDDYQVPNTRADQAAGKRDDDHERDAVLNGSWLHTFGPKLLLTAAPSFHFNRAAYVGGAADTPFISSQDRASHYLGATLELAYTSPVQHAAVGWSGFLQDDAERFGLTASQGGDHRLQQAQRVTGAEQAGFVDEQFHPYAWVRLGAGLRVSRFSGLLREHALSPRLSAALTLPRLHWTLHGSYGRFYQPPPLDTVGGPLLQLTLQQGFAFLPLRGERDEQHELGIAVPWRGWVLDAVQFRTGARNYFDHDVLGNSNIFLPLTIAGARIRGWELSLGSPPGGRLRYGLGGVHAAYSHQKAEGIGAVNGGLIAFVPPAPNYFFLDHDQRDTLSLQWERGLPARSWLHTGMAYGSGFLSVDGPAHLPSHLTFDLALGKAWGERWSAVGSILNLTNHRYLQDVSNSFGGTHVADPRQVVVELRYRFHF